MTMVTISDEDPRSIRAVEIAAGAGQWLKCRTADGRKEYGVPSSCVADRYYLTTCQGCDCPDAQRHPGEPCKHTLAVRLHVALVRAHQARAARPTFVVSHVNAAGETIHLPRRDVPAVEPDAKFWRRFENL